MSPRMQADLLRTLQSGEVRRVGGHDTMHVDVRIIAATHRNLEELVRRGEFRQDLYFRLNVLGLSLPSLRERADDIPLLATELISLLAPPGRKAPRISDAAMRRLVAYRWPGNVRELQNVLRRLCVLGLEEIGDEDLPPEVLSANARSDRPGSLRMAEEEAVRRAFEASAGNKAEAARILGVDRKTLYTKLRRLGIGG
jgi:DNA-binding NtrC family response regulator